MYKKDEKSKNGFRSIGTYSPCVCKIEDSVEHPEAVVLDNCAELYLSENSSRLESYLDSSLTCVWQSYN